MRANDTQVLCVFMIDNFEILEMVNCVIMVQDTLTAFYVICKVLKTVNRQESTCAVSGYLASVASSWVIFWRPRCKHLTQIHFPSNHKSGYDLSRFPL